MAEAKARSVELTIPQNVACKIDVHDLSDGEESPASIEQAPVAGDVFKLFVGGKTASSQEVLAMKVSGKQPEVEGVDGTNISGMTIRKASAMLGDAWLLDFQSNEKGFALRRLSKRQHALYEGG